MTFEMSVGLTHTYKEGPLHPILAGPKGSGGGPKKKGAKKSAKKAAKKKR